MTSLIPSLLPIMITYRSGILQCFNLTTADFPSVEAAHACANQYIAKQRADWSQEMFHHYPDQLLPDCPTGDLFYFTDYKGLGSCIVPTLHAQASSNSSCKLSEGPLWIEMRSLHPKG